MNAMISLIWQVQWIEWMFEVAELVPGFILKKLLKKKLHNTKFIFIGQFWLNFLGLEHFRYFRTENGIQVARVILHWQSYLHYSCALPICPMRGFIPIVLRWRLVFYSWFTIILTNFTQITQNTKKMNNEKLLTWLLQMINRFWSSQTWL